MLGVPVVEVSALHDKNLDELVKRAIAAAKAGKATAGTKCFSSEVEEALDKISKTIERKAQPEELRWYTIKVFERDAQAIKPLGLSKADLDACEKVISALEKERDDDAESIITSDRYDWIADVMASCVKKAPKKLSTSEKIDRIVTNRWLGIPIFVTVICLVYYIAIGTVGTAATDWVNDQLFGDGFFVSATGQDAYDEDNEA